jgi:hypothetical protein
MCDRETVDAELRATKGAVKPTTILSVTRIDQSLAVVVHPSQGAAATGNMLPDDVKPRQLKLFGDQRSRDEPDHPRPSATAHLRANANF